MKTILILSAIVLITIGAQNSCLNPLFTPSSFEKLGVDMPTFRSVPAQMNTNAFCTDYSNANSCCNAASVRSLSAAFDAYSSKLREGLESQLKASVGQCNALDEKKLGVESVRAEILSNMAKSAEECESAALDYSRAMLCLSCAEEQTNLLDDDNLVMVNNADVEGLRTACTNYLTAVKSFQEVVKSLNSEQTETLRPVQAACQKISLKLTKDSESSVELCMDKKLLAFHDYIRAVGQSLVEEWEFDGDYKIKYDALKVSICDTQGCESKEFSPEAAEAFDAYVTRRFYLKRKVEAPAKEFDAIVRAISHGPFFDLDAFMNEDLTVENELISLVVDDGFKPMRFARQASSNTTASSNTAASGSSSGNGSSSGQGSQAANISGAMQTKLANASLQVGNAMGDNALALKVLLVPLAMILAIFA